LIMSDSYIPPEDLCFRLVGYDSQCAIFSRTTPDPQVWHYNISNGTYDDQWFTLLNGSGTREGLYAIKSKYTSKVLFSRSSPDPTVGHIDGDGEYDDNWFDIVSGSGKYTGYFYLTTDGGDLALYSRPSQDPTFGNYTTTSSYSDQLFGFLWEDMQVDGVDFSLDDGKISLSTPLTIADQTLNNSSSSDAELSFTVNDGVVDSSSFEYSTGFTVTAGTAFEVGIPGVVDDKIELQASSTNTWVWGQTTSYTTNYTATFTIKVGPHKSVRATAVVNQGKLDVPYTMSLSSKSAGVK